ncbi:hypothetical protein SAMN06265373_10731 [Shimia sagamensis]|uniref:Uncharacterized protein n=1 Tax=Shimia sagamensis TaxID=1566352 RepID=A0ABY1PAX8_9RHOB|nr:hypothetical protein SAMN06265373_10731 [Shimia sagamensis]
MRQHLVLLWPVLTSNVLGFPPKGLGSLARFLPGAWVFEESLNFRQCLR